MGFMLIPFLGTGMQLLLKASIALNRIEGYKSGYVSILWQRDAEALFGADNLPHYGKYSLFKVEDNDGKDRLARVYCVPFTSQFRVEYFNKDTTVAP